METIWAFQLVGKHLGKHKNGMGENAFSPMPFYILAYQCFVMDLRYSSQFLINLSVGAILFFGRGSAVVKSKIMGWSRAKKWMTAHSDANLDSAITEFREALAAYGRGEKWVQKALEDAGFISPTPGGQ